MESRATRPSIDPRTSLALWLRAGRTQSRLSLDDVARVTKIQPRILEQLETGQLDGLPAEVFVRGFVKSFARCVGLSEGEAVKRYVACAGLASPSSAAARAFIETFVVTPSGRTRLATGTIPPPFGDEAPSETAAAAVQALVETAAAAGVVAAGGADDRGTAEAPVAAARATEPTNGRTKKRRGRRRRESRAKKLQEIVAGADQAASLVVADAAAAADSRVSNPVIAADPSGDGADSNSVVAADVATSGVDETSNPAATSEASDVAANDGGSPNPLVAADAVNAGDDSVTPVVASKTSNAATAGDDSVADDGSSNPLVVARPAGDASTNPAAATAVARGAAADGAAPTALQSSAGQARPTARTGSPKAPWRRPTSLIVAKPVAPSLVIDDADPDLADMQRDEREAAKKPNPQRVSFLPPILLDRDERGGRQGGLTLAVILLLIAATLTLSYLMRRPTVSGDGVTSNASETQTVALLLR